MQTVLIVKSYLDKLSEKNCNFTPVTETAVRNIICKSCQGADGLSVKLIKSIENIIVKSFTLITHQCIETGVFPDELKIANVVPLYQKDDKTLIKNYCPVSISLAISKVIEKITVPQIYEYFTINNLFPKANMVLDKNIPQNLLHMNCLIELYVVWIKVKHLFAFSRFIKGF